MPQKAGAGGLIIGRNAPAAGIAQDGAARLLGAGGLDAAVLHGDDVVRSLFKKARLDAVFPHGDGELGLVAVAPRLIHANDRLHGNLGQAADTA